MIIFWKSEFFLSSPLCSVFFRSELSIEGRGCRECRHWLLINKQKIWITKPLLLPPSLGLGKVDQNNPNSSSSPSPPHQDDLGRPPACLVGGRAVLVQCQNATVHPPALPDYHTTKLHIALSRKTKQKAESTH